MVALEICRTSLAWVSLNATWARMVELNSLHTVNLLKRDLKEVGALLQMPTITSSINHLLPQASRTTTHTRTLALTNKVTKFPIMAEHLMEHLHRVHLSSTVVSMMPSHLVLHHMVSMVRMISSSRATVKVRLRPVMVKDSHLDTTKVVATEVD